MPLVCRYVRVALGLAAWCAAPAHAEVACMDSTCENPAAEEGLSRHRVQPETAVLDSADADGSQGQAVGPAAAEDGAGPGPPRAAGELVSATVVFLHLVSPNKRDHAWPFAGRGHCHLGDSPDRRERNMRYFGKMLPIFNSKFLSHFPYPVTVFYSPFRGVEGDLSIIQELLNATRVEFVSLPSFGKENFHAPLRYEYARYSNSCLMAQLAQKAGECPYDFAYKQMNYIFTYAMFFDTQALSKYRYWMRVDAEVEVLEVPEEDPFAVVARNGWMFSYDAVNPGEHCNKGLPQSIRDFAESHGYEPQDRELYEDYLGRFVNYPGHIGIGDLSFFQSEKYKSMMEHILHTGGIWKYRWDDQHIYAMASALFGSKAQVGRIPMKVNHR